MDSRLRGNDVGFYYWVLYGGFGIRGGRSCQDAIAQCYLRLQNGRDTWVLDADIKGFFDNIAHKSILDMIGSFPRSELIKGWLKSGFILGIIRYADDFVITAKDKASLERVLILIKQWLSERGLEISTLPDSG